MKPVLLIVVDACTSRVLEPAMTRGELPTLARLAAAGTLDLDCTSIFPSITPAATASIVTGGYPRDHGIVGMSWMDPDSGQVRYFGDDVWTVAQRGLAEFFKNFLIRLNDELLTMPTIFQTVERDGRTAGCFNHLVFRGDVSHTVKLPWLLRLWPTVPGEIAVRGPSTLCLGDFVSDRPEPPEPSVTGGLRHRFGLDDDSTAELLMSLPGPHALPDFSVAYFADNDFESHKTGPGDADALQHVDELLGRVFDAWGGLDRVLEQVCVVVTADHSQSDIKPEDAAVHLDEPLAEWQRGDPANDWQDGDEILICPNMRAAEIYVRSKDVEEIRRVGRHLIEDPGVDQVLWRNPEDPDGHFRVLTADRGELCFWPSASGRGVRDTHGGWWEYEGDLDALDARVSGDALSFGDYPNAFERVAAGMGHRQGGRMWVTAQPGFEFEVAGQKPHGGGGSHGSLHQLDSRVPLLVAGAPDGFSLPHASRIVDVAPLCRQVLGLAPGVEPGASRASGASR